MAKARKLKSLTGSQLQALLDETGHNVPATAKKLGVTPQALNRWLRNRNCRRIVSIECVQEIGK